MKAVFDVKPHSGCDDDITRRGHVPASRPYLEAARQAIGDWVLFREARRNGGRQAYVATARVVRVEADRERADRAYARVDQFLAFATPVPLARDGRYAEAPLREMPPGRVGSSLQGRSLRPIGEDDFAAIVLAGLSEVLAPRNAARLGLDIPYDERPAPHDTPGMAEEVDRRVEQILLNRRVRDANFRLEVCRAYDDRCAVTGLRIVNGGGRAEVQAAHVRPVAADGPDVVQNGIALSATVHWLFDRHLISIDEDYRLLVSHNRVPAELRSLFRPASERLHLPGDRHLWPHPAFVAHHRELFAGKGH